MTERKRSYKLGYRNAEIGKPQGQMSKNKWAWVRLYFGVFQIWADYSEKEDGTKTDEVIDLKMMYVVPGGRRQPVTWNLTACTEEELIALKHLWDTAIEWALPVARQRDKEARDAFANGDDSHVRIYREVPQLVYRSGPEHQYGEGVQHGPEDAAGVPRDSADPSRGVRDVRPDVAEPDTGNGEPQNDGPEVDLTPELRQVGEVGDGAQ